MFEQLGFETLTPQQATVWLGLLLGLVFGVAAQRTCFCFRRGVAGDPGERRPALGVWLTALGVAILGTQAAVAAGILSFDEHRFLATDVPVLAIAIGGLLFGAGMVLTRGCVSRLTVLGGSGNLRALTVLLIFAVVAHATIKGVLTPLRTTLGAQTVDLGDAVSLAALPGGAMVWAVLLAAGLIGFGLFSGNRPGTLALAALIGLLVPAGWVGTGFVLLDDFDPVALESLSFTAPAADTIFFLLASTAIPAGFGAGLFAGVLLGSLGAALVSREFAWASFESPRQTGRYAAGAALMGVGGVLAGGCTVGAGLSGVPTLSLAAILALGTIAIGAVVTRRLLATGATGIIPHGVPAE
ncbi:YeeE/YedE family protein [Brevirhabdus pacifica]|uniref:YeeE/YedE family protein n=2 Tax=Brevirhabdus pacifica TaxID=1267768 RepID=A0A1U7DL29_9RHOB|nr:YeeE/YedE family protein [Brevirhabdus pacifica]APX90589.1 YeeE/YedE family protein [Brevirhabdus pacifica]OWU78415.1 YeeE/YedE family protein [Loktanella sp. 22II-4b]PJJ85274.1 sulfur transporter [Brevirhabdus pacifica]